VFFFATTTSNFLTSLSCRSGRRLFLCIYAVHCTIVAEVLTLLLLKRMKPKSSDYQDREMVCQVCGETWIFETGNQIFFAQKGFEDPKRCKACKGRIIPKFRSQRKKNDADVNADPPIKQSDTCESALPSVGIERDADALVGEYRSTTGNDVDLSEFPSFVRDVIDGYPEERLGCFTDCACLYFRSQRARCAFLCDVVRATTSCIAANSIHTSDRLCLIFFGAGGAFIEELMYHAAADRVASLYVLLCDLQYGYEHMKPEDLPKHQDVQSSTSGASIEVLLFDSLQNLNREAMHYHEQGMRVMFCSVFQTVQFSGDPDEMLDQMLAYKNAMNNIVEICDPMSVVFEVGNWINGRTEPAYIVHLRESWGKKKQQIEDRMALYQRGAMARRMKNESTSAENHTDDK
jgi:hypothetical protein